MTFVRRAALISCAVALVMAADAPAAGRVPVVLLGDSIVEATHPGLPAGDGLLPRLRAQLARRGLDPGGGGFVASHPAEIAPVLVPAPPDARGTWSYTGPWAWLTRTPGASSPIVSWTASPKARASLAAPGADSATLLYLEGPRQGRFEFRAGAARLEVAAAAPRSSIGMRTLPLVDGGDPTVEVAGAAQGALGLVGAFLRREPAGDRTQVELTAVAHGGAQAADPATPIEDAGLGVLRPAVTVVMLGTNDGIGYGRSRDPAAIAALRDGIRRRGQRARQTGTCVVVPPARAHFPGPVFAEIRGAVRAGAREAGCRVLPLLDALDRDPALTVDGVHPTSAGYARLAASLAPRILRLAGVEAGSRRSG